MTVQPGLVDPYQLFWDAVNNNQVPLDPYENEQYELIQKTPYATRLNEVVLGLGASFLLYRHWMARNLPKDAPDSAGAAQQSMLALYRQIAPKFNFLLAAVLFSGYRQGVAQAEAGVLPDDYLYDVATNYARQLGDNLNETSTQAMTQGFQAQLNRKVGASRAWRNVRGVFGVPPRTMNSLVASWTVEEPKKFTNAPMTDQREARSAALAQKSIATRAQQIGDTEAWTARTQAKQLVWMYGMAHGVIPSTATRTWVTARDERVCPVCGPLHKAEAPVGEKFAADNGNFWTPPLHPLCRCDVILDWHVTEAVQQEFDQMQDDPLTAQVAIFKRLRRHDRESFAAKYQPGNYQIHPRHLVKLRDSDPRAKTRVKALASDIKSQGINTPLNVSRIEGKAYLMNGHHRLAAARKIGLKKVPVRVQNGSYARDAQGKVVGWVPGDPISKARGGDPYDRDRRGRFAPRESRSFKEPEPQELNELQAAFVRFKAEQEVAPRQEERIAPQRLAKPQRLASTQRLVAPQRLGQETRLEAAPQEAVRLETTRLDRERLERPRLVTNAVRLQHNTARLETVGSKPKTQDEAPGFQLLDRPLYMIQDNEWGDLRAVQDQSQRDMHVFVGVDDELTEDARSIEQDVSSYWDNQYADFLERMEPKMRLHDTLFYSGIKVPDPHNEGRYVTAWVDQDDMYTSFINTVFTDEALDQWTELYIEEPDGTFGVYSMPFHQISSELGMKDFIDENKPLVIKMQWGRPGVTDVSPSKRHGSGFNPGAWKVHTVLDLDSQTIVELLPPD